MVTGTMVTGTMVQCQHTLLHALLLVLGYLLRMQVDWCEGCSGAHVVQLFGSALTRAARMPPRLACDGRVRDCQLSAVDEDTLNCQD